MFLIILCLVSLVEYSPVGSGNRTGPYDCTPGGQHPLSGSGTLVSSRWCGGTDTGMQSAAAGGSGTRTGCSVGFLSGSWLSCFTLRLLPQDGNVVILWPNLSRLISSRNVGPGSIEVAVPPAKDDSYFFPISAFHIYPNQEDFIDTVKQGIISNTV